MTAETLALYHRNRRAALKQRQMCQCCGGRKAVPCRTLCQTCLLQRRRWHRGQQPEFRLSQLKVEAQWARFV